jgi:hypothetical protein
MVSEDSTSNVIVLPVNVLIGRKDDDKAGRRANHN